MWTFFISLILLIGGYFIYSRVTEKIFAIDRRLTPALKNPDGVDATPLPKWKAFLIELLNIAGTGPIFGAISGALFGPIVFLWIVFGCILGGAVHDYFSGMISSRNNGDSIVRLSRKYIGRAMEIVMRIFSIVLLVLVTAVFVVSPSSLMESLTGGTVSAWIWMIIILAYYLLSTLVPIDKVIGKLYPIFGVILIVMALAVIGGVVFQQDKYPMLELINHFQDLSITNGDLPWWPFMLTTVACGAVSGFHATQSPMVAKCIKSEKEGRQVFYGAMVAEGVIALIWAAAAMAFYHVDTAEGWQKLAAVGGSSTSVQHISSTLLGPVGTVLAIVGVVICPITSGDTALRSCRLIMGEWFHLDQKKIRNRLILTLPLFFLIVGISIWNFLDPHNFNLLWRWFAWSNQLLAAASLWVSTFYLMRTHKKNIVSLFTAIPATIMTAVVITYIFGEPRIALGRFVPMWLAYTLGAVLSFLLFLFYLYLTLFKYKKVDSETTVEQTDENDMIYSFKINKRNGDVLDLATLKGKVILIVNTATGCGFTPQYAPMEEMYKKYHDQGLEILDIPCNQFGGQAPGSDEDIHEFCQVHYNTTFEQMKKADVNGENQLPLYKYLKSEQHFRGFDESKMGKLLDDMLSKADPNYASNDDIKWNFTKFIVDREGHVVTRYEPTIDMKIVEECIKALL